MKITRILALALIATLSLGLAACDGESLKEKAEGAMSDAMSLDGIKKQLGEVGDIEAKAKEMGKTDLPAVKDLLAKKPEIQKLVDSLKDMDATKVMSMLKDKAPMLKDFAGLLEKAKSALGM